MENEYDVVIIGSGIVGASLALLLANIFKKIALIEAHPVVETKSSKQSLSKTIVLSHSSRNIFDMLEIWANLAEGAEIIKEIHVSDQGHYGCSRILAKDEKVPALGYVLSAEKIGKVLIAAVNANANIELIQPAKFTSFSYKDNQANVEIDHHGTPICIKGKIVVAADGNFSAVRRFLGIDVQTVDYQQTAILCHVDLKRFHENIAYERFTPQGPLAILPLNKCQAGVVWTVGQEHAKHLMSLSKDAFLQELQKTFGYRIGKFMDCSNLTSLPLNLMLARQQIAPGIVLLGNAVHTIHPVAGQGLNLALRDVAVLGEYLQLANGTTKPIGDMNLLELYLADRQKDQERIINLTHSLVGIFSNSLLPVVFARNVGMLMLDRSKWLKKILTRRALGFAGKVPRLACGMPLE